jgi:hypothetical protein
MRTGEGCCAMRSLTPGRIVRDAHGLAWQVDGAPRWCGEQVRVRARLLRCDGVWGDLPADVLEPTALVVSGGPE